VDAALWGLIGTIVGALASIGTTWISGRHAVSLQRQAASLDRLERARAFQRETLIELQDALHDALRMVTRAHLEDVAAFKKGEKWGSSFLSAEVNEGVRLAARRVSILIERVANDALRSDLKKIAGATGQVCLANSEAEGQASLEHAYATGNNVTQHIGSVLRSLY
jgi:hypothetical protein